MEESKKLKRKLSLNRETLRSLADNELQHLDGVVGGTGGTTSTAFPTATTCPNEVPPG